MLRSLVGSEMCIRDRYYSATLLSKRSQTEETEEKTGYTLLIYGEHLKKAKYSMAKLIKLIKNNQPHQAQCNPIRYLPHCGHHKHTDPLV